ncbi:hypothetical protein ABTM19_21315, partial [Acinetobacter baumannii]
IWRRSRQPTVTLKAGIIDDIQPATAVDQLKPSIDRFVSTLPAGYRVAVGGSVEESLKSQAPIVAVVPLMLIVMMTVLMV